MECESCDRHANTRCTDCRILLCYVCSEQCAECSKNLCMECVASCDLCDRSICKKCSFNINVCKCCKRSVSFAHSGNLCTPCLLLDWFSSCKHEGFVCSACETHCTEKMCNVTTIMEGQDSCPICFDTFTAQPTTLQLCEVHRVCDSCNYDTRHGCPLCRVGHVTHCL